MSSIHLKPTNLNPKYLYTYGYVKYFDAILSYAIAYMADSGTILKYLHFAMQQIVKSLISNFI